MLLAQTYSTHDAFAAQEDNSENSLVIRHISKTQDGEKHVLGVETIENLTDIYYYRAAGSPVASGFLKNGYSLADEKNALIEADVVSNSGKIDLEYTPAVQNVNVTYYKNENGKETEMGTITSSAYVGENFKPLPPVYEEANVLAELVGDEKHTVKYGDNNIKVSYTVREKAKKSSSSRSGRSSSSSGGKTAQLSNIELKRDEAYVSGYPDFTFRPDNNLAKRELFSIMYCLSGSYSSKRKGTMPDAAAFLKEQGIIPADEAGLNDFVTWSEFYTYMEKLNDKLPPKGKLTALEPDSRSKFYDADACVKRAEAVTAINEMLGGGQKNSLSAFSAENPFRDVFEDYWAYHDIMRAAAGNKK